MTTKFIVDSYKEPVFSAEFETNKSLTYVFDDLQRGMYHVELIHPKGNTPLIRIHESTLGSTRLYEHLTKNYSLTEESPDFEFNTEDATESISISHLETSTVPIGEVKELLIKELGVTEEEIQYSKNAAYVGAEAEFLNLIVNISGGLITYGSIKIIEALTNLGTETPVHRTKPTEYKSYLENKYEVNKNSLAFVRETESEIVYSTRRTVYTIYLDEKGNIKESHKQELTQTGI